MWLYYAFSSAIVLFLGVIHNPEATLNLLISDLENLWAHLVSFSLGAKQVMYVSREMNKVAFDIIEASAKWKAQDNLDNKDLDRVDSSSVVPRILRARYRTLGAIDRVSRQASGTPSQVVVHVRSDEHLFNPFPANFPWDDWDQWLKYAAL